MTTFSTSVDAIRDLMGMVVMLQQQTALQAAILQTLMNGGLAANPTNTSLTTVQTNRDRSIHTPNDIWVRIFKYLCPSQLARVATTCRTFHDIVACLPLWREIYCNLHPNNENHLPRSVKPVLEKFQLKDFMIHLCVESRRVCEGCHNTRDNSGEIPHDRLASWPLPVDVQYLGIVSRFHVADPLEDKISGPQRWTIRLCLSCRREAFQVHKLPIRQTGWTEPLTTAEVGERFHLTHEELNILRGGGAATRLPPERNLRYPLEYVLWAARMKYGGDVGLAAAAPGSAMEVTESTLSRLASIRRPPNVDPVDDLSFIELSETPRN